VQKGGTEMIRLDTNTAIVRLNALMDRIDEFRDYGTAEHMDFYSWRKNVLELIKRQAGCDSKAYQEFSSIDFSRAHEEYTVRMNLGVKFRNAIDKAETLLSDVREEWERMRQEEIRDVKREDNNIAAPKIFISHAATEDHDIANALRQWIIKEYGLQKEDVFVSSSPDSIGSDDFWLTEIGKALRSCSALVLLLTKESILKRWVLFEVGAAFGSGKLLPPLLCKGATIGDIPDKDPLLALQAKLAGDKAELVAFLEKLDKKLEFNEEHDSAPVEKLRLCLCNVAHSIVTHDLAVNDVGIESGKEIR